MPVSETAAVDAVLRTLADKVRPEHTALLIVDMCNDFVHPDGKTAQRAGRAVRHAQAVIPRMRELLAAARAAGVLVVHCQHTTLPDGRSASGPWLDARSRAAYSVLDIGLDGTWGQQILDELAPVPSDVIVKKYRYGGFTGTNLDIVLCSTGRRTVVCCGVSTNVCVETTAREAFSRDYYVVIPEDACASWDMALHAATLESARHRYGTVCATADLTELWGAASTTTPRSRA
jgi:nicotinamidase-related amidase